ncbi:hypothetical protein D0T12_10705 [Actinomadura spongiicola]|uniref:WXG100 family type VII secretion target n=1 Tax=Actinomadura spongiicola TaxID=2303421 RepID=A0A372GJF6_9ACTN|nr:hypothetical protein [Actinomadura spongiicola]RFS85494.1 hypothetical protein D0T12_10705 [Actinomadura spongiicola]
MGRWDQGQNTLIHLAKQTGASGEELAGLVRQLIVAAEPLSGKFNGAGKAAFDSFKARSDQICADLKGGLDRVNTGQLGMERAFSGGDQEMADEGSRAMGAANFDGAKFRTA